MGSRRKTGVEGVRLPELSRRAVIAGTSLAAFGAAKPAAALVTPPVAALTAPDGGAKRCARWLAINAKIERLQTRWAKPEGGLGKEHAWYRLSPPEQQALPWAKELRDIDGCLDLLFEQRDALLESLIAQREDGERFEASVTDAGRLFHVKLRVAAQGVHEYGREEDL